MKGTEDDTNGKLYCGRINFAKMTVLPKESTDSVQSLLKY